jgi:predicted DNA-binding ribbon-helix-helix protein
MASLLLSLNNLSVEIGCACSPFLAGGYKRTMLDFAQVERTIVGTPMMGSPFYINPFFWEIQSILKETEMTMLQLIYKTSDNLRRQHKPYSVNCQDTIEFIVEESTNSRQIATGFSLQTIENTAGIKYYGAFPVWIGNLEIQRIKTSHLWQASFQLTELDPLS